MDFEENAVIGVEATAYLQQMMKTPPSHEPLHAALAGEPMSLKLHIERELDAWKANKMRPVFVFDGQSVIGSEEVTLANAAVALTKTNHAWDVYGKENANVAVKTFSLSRKPHDLSN